MKKIAVISIIATLILGCGCKSTKNPVDPKFQNPETNTSLNAESGFNQETYIWENWIFPKSK